MTNRRAIAIVAFLCAFTLIRVASTHRVFSPTFDEPIHVAAGYEYLTQHDYRMDVEHPPLARAFFAWPFRHATTAAEGWVELGNELYASAGDYLRGVASARRGNLPFVLLALVATTAWAWKRFGSETAVIACAAFAMLPPVLAHAGLATTDMAATASFALAMWVFELWLDQTTWLRTAALGVAAGFGLVTKYSFPLFFGICALILLVSRRRAPVVKAAVALLVALLVIWTVYGFDLRRLTKADGRTAAWATELFGSPWLATKNDLPASSYIAGLMEVTLHSRHGHPTYLLGRVSDKGWWYYFPVVFAIKTPIALLLLVAAGAWVMVRRRAHLELLASALAILGVSMTTHLNLGVRHILPIYVPLSIVAAAGCVELWRTRAKWVVAGTLAWLVIGGLAAHPDYVPWANALGGRHPERIAIDSNFDWGQDVARLRTVCRRERITDLGWFVFGTSDLQRIGLPQIHDLDPFTHSSGWIAISESAIVPAQARDRLAYFWLTSAYRFQRVGKTIRLYHVTD